MTNVGFCHAAICSGVAAAVILVNACAGSPTAPSASTSSGQTFFAFDSEPGDWIGSGLSRRYTPDNATIRAVQDLDGNRLQVDVDTLDWKEDWTLRAAAPLGERLRPGTYGPVDMYGSPTATLPGLTFWGSGRGCFPVSGTFTIQVLKLGSLREIDTLAMTFLHRCSEGTAALVGEVRFVNGPVR